MIEYVRIRYVRPDISHFEFNSDDAKNFKERFLSMEEGSTLNLKFERTDSYSPTSQIFFQTHHSTDVNGIKTFHISRNVKGGTTSSTTPYIQQYFAENFIF